MVINSRELVVTRKDSGLIYEVTDAREQKYPLVVIKNTLLMSDLVVSCGY